MRTGCSSWAIARREHPAALSDEEAAVHGFCASILAEGQVTDDCFQRVAARWGRRGVVDLIVLVGYYVTLCHVYNIAQFPLAEGDLPFEP